MSRFVLSGSFSAYKSGDYVAFNNTWGLGSLVNGVDFYQTVSLETTDPTTGITFSWSWPERESGQIYGYPSIVWGDSPFYDGAEECHSYISKVSDLHTFEVDFDIAASGAAQYVNVSFDMFLTNKAFGGEDSMTSEVMIWLDNKASDVWGNVVGTFSDGTRTAKIYFAEGHGSADYIAVVFDKPWFSGTIDIKAVLQDLAKKGLISADDYISGHQLGTELAGGKGSLTINSLSTTFSENHAPALSVVIDDQSATERDDFHFQFDNGVFTDSDKDLLTYSATLADGSHIPSWLTFDAATRTFYGIPVDGAAGLLDIKVTATDGIASVSDIFSIHVEAHVAPARELPENLTLRGTARNDRLLGGEGDDTLQGMRGRDRLDGGDGMDTASYKNARSGVVANLEHASDGRGDAMGDKFIGIENLYGSRFADKLIGDGSDNVIDGNKGNDRLTGGGGADVFVFAAKYGKDVITDFDLRGSDHDRIDLSGVRDIDGFDDLIAHHVRDIASSLVITAGDGSRLTLRDVASISHLTSDHFIF